MIFTFHQILEGGKKMSDPKLTTKACKRFYEWVKGTPEYGTRGQSPTALEDMNYAFSSEVLNHLERAALAQEVIINAAEDGRKVDNLVELLDQYCAKHGLDF